MNELQVFNSPEFGQVRTLVVNDEPYFVGKDVAEALGYADSKSAIADHVDAEDKQILQKGQIATLEIPNRGVTIINESGVYSLVFGSKLDSAKKFKRWVTSEVLPAIRKHGAYMTDNVIEQALTSPDFLIQLATNLKEEKAKREQAEATIEKNQPMVLFASAVSNSSSTVLVRDLAKVLKQNGVDIGQNRLFEDLRNQGYLIKSGSDKNLPTQKAMNLGLFYIKYGQHLNGNGSNIMTRTPKVTGKGQIYFVNKYLSQQGGII